MTNGNMTSGATALATRRFLPIGPAVRAPASPLPAMDLGALGRQVCVGDLVFIRIPWPPFRRVADVTGSWTNHVGIVLNTDGRDPIVAESRFPFSRQSSLAHFVRRSERRQVAIARLKSPLTDSQRERLRRAARNRLGIFYDTGFDLHSPRQFCSRYVREVVHEATGVSLGEVVTFFELLARRPDSDLSFWLFWYFGRIPWSRETVSPASLLDSSHLLTPFHGTVHRPGERDRSRSG